MTNPFRSQVGLRGVDSTSPAWVNDITGMSTELVAALAMPSDVFGVIGVESDPTAQVWESVHRNAYDRMLSESLLMLSEKYDFQPVIARTANPKQTPFGQRFSDALLGADLVIPYVEDAQISLNMAGVLVTAIAPQYVESTIRVLDLNAGIQLAQVVQSLHLGYNRIPLSICRETTLMQDEHLVVVVDAAKLTLAELTLRGFSSGSESCNAGTMSGVNIVTVNPVSYSAIPAATYVHVDVEITRSLPSLLLRYTKDLRTAYTYLCASMLLLEKMASPNLSVFTLSNLTFTEKLQASLLDDFKRALRPVIRLLSNDLTKQQAITAPEPTPDQVTIRYGSFV